METVSVTVNMASTPALFGPYGRGLSTGPLVEAPELSEGVWRPAAAFMDEEAVERMVRGHAEKNGIEDLPAAASAWAKHHVAALMPGPMVAMSLHRVGLDLAPDNVAFHVADDTVRTARVLDADRARAGDDGVTLVVASLFRDHLAPLYRNVTRVTSLSGSILWGNVGNYLAYLYDVLEEAHPDEPNVAADRALLLGSAEAPWGDGKNPLQDPVRYDTLGTPGLPDRIQVRRTCCLKLRIPGRLACTTCPTLTVEERIALLRRIEAAK